MKLEARDLPDLLREFAGWRKRAADGRPLTVPVVTLWLRSGARLTGFVAEVRDPEYGRDVPMVLLLQLPDDPRQSPSDAIHVPLGSVEAVTVHDYERAGEAHHDAAGPKSQQELLRDVKPIEEELQAAGVPARWVLQPDGLDDARVLGALGALAVTARTALRKIAETAKGKAALQAISEIRLAIGTAPAAREGGALLLCTALDLAHWPANEELVSKIESVL